MTIVAGSHRGLVLVVAGALLIGCIAPSDGIAVEEPWIRATAPFANTAALYVTIQNQTGQDDTLVAIDSPTCQEFEIHRTELNDGVASMRPIDSEGLPLPEGQTITLEPAGLHGMCMGLAGELQDGDKVRLLLRFQTYDDIELSVPVRRN